MKSEFTFLSANTETKTKKFKKEILRVGDFLTTEGSEFRIDSGNLQQLKKTFDAMMSNGVKVPVPVEHSFDAEDNRGWVTGMSVEGDALVATMDLSDKIEDPNLYDVSVYIPQSWTDGEGHVYAQPIRHVALTSYPRITGLGDFRAIVASLNPVSGGKAMGFDFKKLGVDLGIQGELTEDNAAELVLSDRKSLTDEIADLKEQLKTATSPEKKTLEDLKELAASHPGLIKVGKSGREAKLDALVGKAISPAVCTALKELYCSDDAVTLSLDESESDFDRVCAILEKNSLVELKELTGPQGETLVLSDPGKGNGGDSPLMADAKRRQERFAKK